MALKELSVATSRQRTDLNWADAPTEMSSTELKLLVNQVFDLLAENDVINIVFDDVAEAVVKFSQLLAAIQKESQRSLQVVKTERTNSNDMVGVKLAVRYKLRPGEPEWPKGDIITDDMTTDQVKWIRVSMPPIEVGRTDTVEVNGQTYQWRHLTIADRQRVKKLYPNGPDTSV